MAEVFLDFKSKFLIYGQFCATLQLAQQTLDGLVSKSDTVREDVARCEQVNKLFKPDYSNSSIRVTVRLITKSLTILYIYKAVGVESVLLLANGNSRWGRGAMTKLRH